jgi:predicted GNAT family acetyltransferase
VLTTSALKVLGPSDVRELGRLLARDPVRHVFVASRLHASAMQTWRLGGEIWGWFRGDELVSACYAGANLVPVEGVPESLFAFADRARRLGRRCSSIVGPTEEVGELWRHLQHAWGPARDVRMQQPVLLCDRAPSVVADPAVRRVREDEIHLLLPASVAMFTEEVGVPPTQGDSMTAYRSRVLEIVRAGHSFARIENGRVLFKAEIGAVAGSVCQVQGVWVEPALRGRGVAAPGMAAVVEQAREAGLTDVTLYVNDYNTPARATYARTGFREVDRFASVLF